ncbi:hypothetical protein HKT18_09450 [Flavobacterium sp. IMCC34852]|uniref:Uncharacterized protein n=1 Tax=Flavobacterium rivulicola TaxID=2732161 RepID=A0A7Y3VZ71_9FLAO|nr:hypothetical protein [Flavobacterium sp. IMCC34852]NNT72438.1 hypothetical protein [Flavobacterium sp. IMCC34852]
MKGLKVLNTIALAIPISFALLSIVDDGLLIAAVVSTMATGFIQLMASIYFWVEYPKSIHIKIYFFFVGTFFFLLFTKLTDDWYWVMPPILCLYLSVLIYTKKE